MKKRRSIRGVIPIALAFAIVISIILIAITGVFWSRTPLSVSRLKRNHAIDYARVALHEAGYRFRTHYVDPDSYTWDTQTWGTGKRVINIEGVPVSISVTQVNTGGVVRDKVSATVDYDNVPI